MELSEVIKKRRSIRKYEDKEVSWNLISEILDAARFAPAAGNVQSYKFIVIKDKEKRKSISEACFNQEWIASAPVHIVVCATPSVLKKLYGARGETSYSYQNSSAAIQNLLLTAYDLGLGACWVAAFDDKKVIELLEIPSDVKPIAIIILGYPKESPLTPRKDSLDTLVYFEKWKEKQRPETAPQPLNKSIEKHVSKLKEFLKKINEPSEEQINNKFRFRINGLK